MNSEIFKNMWMKALGSITKYSVNLGSILTPTSLLSSRAAAYVWSVIKPKYLGTFSTKKYATNADLAKSVNNLTLSSEYLDSTISEVSGKQFNIMNYLTGTKEIDMSDTNLTAFSISQPADSAVEKLSLPKLTSLKMNGMKKLSLANAQIDEEAVQTIVRNEYDDDSDVDDDWTEDSESEVTNVLGLPSRSVSRSFAVGIKAGNGALKIKDVADLDSLSIKTKLSDSAMSLAADIASVRLQPRLIPSAFTTPKVNGFEMQVKTGEGVPDGYKVFALPKVGEEVTRTSKAASLAAVDDTFSWTDADGGHSFTRSELMVAVAECLGASNVTGCVALGKMTEVVSVIGGMTDTEALMDGRTSMAGYPVEGAADVVWATVPYAQLMSMAEKPFKGTRVLTALLVALGMPSGMARSECQLLSGGSLKEMTLNYGVLSSDTALQYGTDSLLACKAGTTQRPWIDCGIDGDSMLLWVGNQCVFSLLSAMAKKRMDSLCGLALVGVGENGGVMSWMVDWNTKYGISYPNLIALNSSSKIATLKEIYNLDKENYNMMQTSDGKVYVRVCHHFINNGSIMFANATAAGYTLNDANRYSILSKIADIGQLNDTFEFYVEQYVNVGDSTPSVMIWSQTSNPAVSSSLSGFVNISNMDKGIAKYSSSTFMCYASDAWWGAIGSYTAYSGGIPGLKQQVVKGTQNTYLRVL